MTRQKNFRLPEETIEQIRLIRLEKEYEIGIPLSDSAIVIKAINDLFLKETEGLYKKKKEVEK